MTEEEQYLLMAKGAISEMPQVGRDKVNEIIKKLKDAIDDSMESHLALGIVTIEVSIKEATD